MLNSMELIVIEILGHVSCRMRDHSPAQKCLPCLEIVHHRVKMPEIDVSEQR